MSSVNIKRNGVFSESFGIKWAPESTILLLLFYHDCYHYLTVFRVWHMCSLFEMIIILFWSMLAHHALKCFFLTIPVSLLSTLYGIRWLDACQYLRLPVSIFVLSQQLNPFHILKRNGEKMHSLCPVCFLCIWYDYKSMHSVLQMVLVDGDNMVLIQVSFLGQCWIFSSYHL